MPGARKVRKRFPEEDLRVECSALSGYGTYLFPPEGDLSEGKALRAVHIPSGQEVQVLPLRESADPAAVRRHEERILWPPSRRYFQWPVDLVRSGDLLGLVFPLDPRPGMKPLRELLYQSPGSTVLDWRHPEIRQLCRSLLCALQNLEAAGCACFDMNMNRILYGGQDMSVYFLYSRLIRKFPAEWADEPVPAEAVSMEFAPPYIYEEGYRGDPPLQMERFSLAALLFRLMVGRLPYEGKGVAAHGAVLDPVRDTDEGARRNYFRHYHAFPVFIFSSQDTDNRLSPVVENDLPRERWEALPETVKDMFEGAFLRSTATRLTDERLPDPAAWLEALELLEEETGRDGSGS